jgi:hypothetical protein
MLHSAPCSVLYSKQLVQCDTMSLCSQQLLQYSISRSILYVVVAAQQFSVDHTL